MNSGNTNNCENNNINNSFESSFQTDYFKDIDQLFSGVLKTPLKTDLTTEIINVQKNNIDLSPTSSSQTISANSSVDPLNHHNSTTTIDTHDLNELKSKNMHIEYDSKLSNFKHHPLKETIETGSSKDKEGMFKFDPYAGYLPSSYEEEIMMTADPSELFLPVENSVINDLNAFETKINLPGIISTDEIEKQFEITSPISSRRSSYKVEKTFKRRKSSTKESIFSHIDNLETSFGNTQSSVNIPILVSNSNSSLISIPIHESVSCDKITEVDNANQEFKEVPQNCLPTVFESIDKLPKINHSKHKCNGCFKVSKSSYGCSKKIVKNLPNLKLYKEYNTPNGYDIEYAKKYGDQQYVYLSSEVKNGYDPLVKRYTKTVQYNSKGKKLKRDYPSLCPFCKVTESKKFDSLFYERNNSCYRGHLINTHGVNSTGVFAKLPEAGFVCYKLGKNVWTETIGFKCPYNDCNFCFLKGDKTHGFHEYIRHWNRTHIE